MARLLSQSQPPSPTQTLLLELLFFGHNGPDLSNSLSLASPKQIHLQRVRRTYCAPVQVIRQASSTVSVATLKQPVLVWLHLVWTLFLRPTLWLLRNLIKTISAPTTMPIKRLDTTSLTRRYLRAHRISLIVAVCAALVACTALLDCSTISCLQSMNGLLLLLLLLLLLPVSSSVTD